MELRRRYDRPLRNTGVLPLRNTGVLSRGAYPPWKSAGISLPTLGNGPGRTTGRTSIMGTGAMNYCWNCGRWSEIVYLRTICAECLNVLHLGKMSGDEAPVSSRRRDTAVSPDDGRTRAGGAEALSARESVEVSLARAG
jgi:hypothetical protein